MGKTHDDKSQKKPAGPVVEPPTKGANAALRQAGSLAAQDALLKPKDQGKPAKADSSLKGEMAVVILEGMMQGQSAKDAAKQIPAEHKATADAVLQTILESEFLVKSWISKGSTRTSDSGSVEVVKPTPAHAIAGWLGLLPKDPMFTPGTP